MKYLLIISLTIVWAFIIAYILNVSLVIGFVLSCLLTYYIVDDEI